MKKILFISILFLQLAIAKGQAWIYHPMPDSNAVWRQYHLNWSGGPTGCDFEYQYTMNSDTIIGTYTYHKIYTTGIGNIYCPPEYYYHFYVGGMRQDIPAKKVYFHSYNDTTERLLYDFSLNVGDTIKRYYNGTEGYSFSSFTSGAALITEIDSVLVGSNYYKRFKNLNSSANFEFIEGVGSKSGLIETWMPGLEASWRLTCFKKNDTIIYSPPYSGTCDLVDSSWVGIYKYNKIEIAVSISPNPNNGQMTLSYHLAQTAELSIYDMQGRRLITYTLPPNNQTLNLNLEELNAGIYYYSLHTHDKQLKTEKLVIVK